MKEYKWYLYYNPFFNMIYESPFRRKQKGFFYLYGMKESEDMKCYYIGEL